MKSLILLALGVLLFGKGAMASDLMLTADPLQIKCMARYGGIGKLTQLIGVADGKVIIKHRDQVLLTSNTISKAHLDWFLNYCEQELQLAKAQGVEAKIHLPSFLFTINRSNLNPEGSSIGGSTNGLPEASAPLGPNPLGI